MENREQTVRHYLNILILIDEKNVDRPVAVTCSTPLLKMIAKDGEIVSLMEPVACVGQVEKWLDQLMSSMRGTLRNELRISIQEYDDTPREQWLFNYPAQVSLEHQNQELLFQDYSFSSR